MSHPDGSGTDYSYNIAGYVAQVSKPGAASTPEVTRYLQYDSAGRPLAVQDATGVVTKYEYDTPDGSLSAVSFSEADGATFTGTNSKNNAVFSYDALGRLSDKRDGTGTVHVDYLPSGGGVQAVTTQYNGPLCAPAPLKTTLTLGYSYNPDGSRSSLTTPRWQNCLRL